MAETATTARQTMERLLDHLSTETVFGPVTTLGETTVIPVSAVAFGLGFGAGTAPANGAAGSAEATAGGSGGGGGGRIEPRGYIRITGGKVRYEPITDQSRIIVAVLLMIAWNVFWIARTIRAAVSRGH